MTEQPSKAARNAAMRADRAAGMTYKAIGDKYGVSQQAAQDLLTRKHVDYATRDAEIIAARARGESLEALAQRYGIGLTRVAQITAGVEQPSPFVARDAEIIAARRRGETAAAVAARYGLHANTVSRVTARAGVKVPPGPKPKPTDDGLTIPPPPLAAVGTATGDRPTAPGHYVLDAGGAWRQLPVGDISVVSVVPQGGGGGAPHGRPTLPPVPAWRRWLRRLLRRGIA